MSAENTKKTEQLQQEIAPKNEDQESEDDYSADEGFEKVEEEKKKE